MPADIVHYFDYKSPYAYLAQAALYELAETTDLRVEWRPYTLDIPSYLGAAEVDDDGRVLDASRNAHQWRRVKYSYMDCRREANRRGLTIRGPRKIFDTALAHIGFLFALEAGNFRRYHDTVFERFWLRELDLEDPAAIRGILEESGIDAADFNAFAATTGRTLLETIRLEAEADGVFGVPSYMVGTELFWGAERFDRAREAATVARGVS